MTVIERHEARLQARLDAAEAEIAQYEQELIEVRREKRLTHLGGHFLIYDERPQWAAPIVIMTADELARL